MRALKDLQPYRNGPRPEWVKVMVARHRKTLVVCRACHDGIHLGNPVAVARRVLDNWHSHTQLSDSKGLTKNERTMDRAAWIRERRRINEERMDTLFAPIYDERWGGYINPTHQKMIEGFLALLPPRAQLLDAACGTGKYWPLLLQNGRSLLGTDQSTGMLRQAQAKFPEVPVEKLGLQELSFRDMFDGITCIDAMENVFPEDWPRVLHNFHRALKPHGLLYLTVEIPEDELPTVFREAVEAGLPVVQGEWVHDGAYHYYPTMQQIRAWVEAAGFDIVDEAEGDGYNHMIMRTR